MSAFKDGNKGGLSTPYSKGNNMGQTAQPSIKVGYSDGNNQTRREGDPDSDHGK